MSRRLRIAVVGGPMYDALYAARLPAFTAETGVEVEVGVKLIHSALNERLAAEYAAESGDYDLISTHGKYAAAQAGWLLPLDDLLPDDALADFATATVDGARVGGVLLGVPRNVDTRLLHYRKGLFADPDEQEAFRARFGYELGPPRTWDELADVARHFSRPPDLYGFAFPGRASGLWGTFFELVSAAGGRFFGPDLRAGFASEAGSWALGYMRDLYGTWGVMPPEVPAWEFDAVTGAFDAGRVAMIGDWPATYAGHVAAMGDRFDVALCPAGPAGRFVYSGGFTWAIPMSARDPELAMRLLLHLSDEASQRVEAERGTLVPRGRVQAAMRAAVVTGSREERRLEMLEETVATSLLIPPRFAAYPAMEDAVWPMLRRAMMGEIEVEVGLREAARAMELVVGGDS